MRSMIRSRCLAVVSIALLALLGCAGEAPEEETAFAAEEAVPAPETSPGGGTAGMQTGREAPVEVVLTDFRIQMPSTLEAGPTTLQIRNAGAVDHNLEVEGQGIERELPSNLAPDESGTLEVDLEPGTYTVYCPVGDHRSRGMEMTLTVMERPGG